MGVMNLVLVIWRIYTVVMAENYPLNFWISQALNGLVLGGVYALVALGYTLVYGILLMINFAHGDVVMIGLPDSLRCSISRRLAGWKARRRWWCLRSC